MDNELIVYVYKLTADVPTIHLIDFDYSARTGSTWMMTSCCNTPHNPSREQVVQFRFGTALMPLRHALSFGRWCGKCKELAHA